LRVWHFFTRPRGDRRWDLFLRATGIAALFGFPILYLFPDSVPLVWLALVGIPANGPLSPILPTAFDPLIMEIGKYSPAIQTTLVAVGIYMYTEFINWHIYAWVLNWERMATFRTSRIVRWGTDRFAIAPMTTVIFFAATPLPFWVVRSLAILKEYSIGRFMMATAIGRFPRFFIYAWLGATLSVPTYLIIAVIVLGGMVAVGVKVAKGEAILGDTVFDPSTKSKPVIVKPPLTASKDA
jgi:hypothetical protein